MRSWLIFFSLLYVTSQKWLKDCFSICFHTQPWISVCHNKKKKVTNVDLFLLQVTNDSLICSFIFYSFTYCRTANYTSSLGLLIFSTFKWHGPQRVKSWPNEEPQSIRRKINRQRVWESWTKPEVGGRGGGRHVALATRVHVREFTSDIYYVLTLSPWLTQ